MTRGLRSTAQGSSHFLIPQSCIFFLEYVMHLCQHKIQSIFNLTSPLGTCSTASLRTQFWQELKLQSLAVLGLNSSYAF